MADIFTPYSTVVPFAGSAKAAGYVPAEDAERILSYQLYDEIYWNHPETFRLALRGDNGKPIYIPSGRIIIDAISRFVAPKMTFRYDGGETEAATLKLAFEALFKREKFRSRFQSEKRNGLKRGDWLFHVRADDTKLPGSRIRINAVDPASYFPVYDDNDLDRIIRVHLVEQFILDDKDMVKKQTYEYDEAGNVISSTGIYKPDEWTALDASPVLELRPPTPLPPAVRTIPVYHFRNQYEDGNPFGSSEMRGLERLMAGINQTLTDEDLALALEGLGVYKSGGGAPIDDDGNETTWVIGPGRVVEDDTFERVNGVSSVGPYLEHLDKIFTFMLQASGTPEATIGKVDVQVAESGISLALQMAPILARAGEKNVEILDVANQMLYDLQTMWFPSFEGITVAPEAAQVTMIFGDPLPVNEAGEVEKFTALVASGLMSQTTAREELAKRGITFAPDELARIVAEKKLAAEQNAAAAVAADPYAARVAAETADAGS